MRLMASGAPGQAKTTVLGILWGWLRKEQQRKQWEKVVSALSPEDLERCHRALKKEKAPPSGVGDSLKTYTRWYTSEKKKRADFLAKLPAASPAIAKSKDQLRQMILRGDEPLTDKEIARICKNEESLAEYFVSLSVEQLETLKQALRDNVVAIDPPVKQTLLKLIGMVQEERFTFEQERTRTIGPEIRRISTMAALHQKILALEKIQKSLSTKTA